MVGADPASAFEAGFGMSISKGESDAEVMRFWDGLLKESFLERLR